MNLRDRRQAENRPPNMSESLQTDGSERMQNWNDTTEKYRMLLEEQSETICTQKDTISEQERIIRRQALDIGKQGGENIGATKQPGAGQNQSDRDRKQSERTARERTIRKRFADLAGTKSGTGMEEESSKSRAEYELDGTELFLADIRSQVRDSESQRQNREAERCRRSVERERKAKETKRGIAKEREESQGRGGERGHSR